ncbi:glycoside hydrolase domain-containing protein [Streptomyces sp. NPDC058576]|uniref:glycoside hydrolase domain-containing protein n=1 Tax=Streptomyces sp. NPDC058576 TaxID=3346547 RepID=UPI0036682310
MADAKVLEGQKWVNATYAGVSGYVKCPENGQTSWSTMNSLIMGLQHELGISPVVASFGATTMSKLEALKGITDGENQPNKNIPYIVRYGLFCKGYWGEAGDTFNADALESMKKNMGIWQEGQEGWNRMVQAKVFKALLTMDSYVVVAGGTDKIRGIQQWLNGLYWEKSAYSIGPCDGLYSRDVQKSLVIALQYEMGIASPNGNFGTGTQAALKNHTLAQGATGIMVRLFTAACVFNEPVPVGEYAERTSFTSTFDAAITRYVKLFQSFSYLPASGNGDYDTWSQLLVSMGNPDRKVFGSDTRFVINADRARWLKNNDYQIVGRYLYSPDPKFEKEILPGELEVILNAGLKFFPIMQVHGRDVTEYTYTTGFQHALIAHEKATTFGIPRGSVIYFAVDYDATQDQMDPYVVKYYQGVVAGLADRGKKYVHGVYGSRNVCINVTNKTYARYSFVSGMSWGFSGNLGYPLPANWSLNQIKEISGIEIGGAGGKIDLDNTVWRLREDGGDPGVSSLATAASPAADFISYIDQLYATAQEYKAANSTNRSASQLVMEFVRHEDYGGYNWGYLIGPYDRDWVAYAERKGHKVKEEFVDPVSGYEMGPEHLLATANGHLLYAQPANAKSVNAGDIAGWAGDLMTFYANWRNDEQQYASGKAYCDAKLAKPGISSSFSFKDLLEDADGYLIARACADGTPINQFVRAYYGDGGGHRTRFTQYFNKRFFTAADCKAQAYNALTMENETYNVARSALILATGAQSPTVLANLPGGFDKLQSFCQGFADAIIARMGSES